MKISGCIAIITIIVLGSILGVRAQGNTTNTGTEFWTAYMDHVDGAGVHASQMVLYITSNVNTSGNVTIADNSFSQDFSVTANQVSLVTIPSSAFLGDVEGYFPKGIHITSLKPVAIYAHIFAASVSGATLLLPVNSMGKDYYSINYTQLSNSIGQEGEDKPSYSFFGVIATENNTTVEVTPSADLLSGNPANVPFKITLKKGEVLQGLSNSDLTGTRIRSISSTGASCTKIAVFSGSSKIEIGCDTTATTSDNLFQQVYPTASWGKNYITAPLSKRNYDIFRVVLSNPNTTVKINGTQIPQFAFTNNRYYEFTSTTPNIISADQPIQVVQYAVTQGKTLDCNSFDKNDLGDPEMIYLTPIEQTIDRVTLYSTSNFQILEDFINVIIKTAAVKTFTLDGAPYTTFKPVPADPIYSYAQIRVQSGTHNISASDGFNAIAYGFGDRESYGYAAGTNLQNLTEYIALDNPVTDTIQSNGCSGVNYRVQVTLPYQTTYIKWDFKNGSPIYTDNNPVVKKTIVKEGKTLYVYEYPNTVNYKVGDYTVVASVFNPIGDDCGSNQDIQLDYNISDPPKANYSIASNCVGDTTIFKDMSDPNGNSIKTWLWDFGDGQTSIVQNPAHLYAKLGDYQVHLIVNNQNGCASDYTQTVHISSKPVSAFKYSVPACTGGNVLFTDQSISVENIVKWIWDYGDGTPVETRMDNKPFSHIYQNTGPAAVKLIAVLASGCTSDIYTQNINIFPLPVVDFAMPDVCLADAYARFTDKSTIADNTQDSFIYSWDFGDGSAPSTDKNPAHKYAQAANYQVTLTVTSKSGCSFFKTQTFTVNGDNPKAAFNIENANGLCSSNDVIFDDKSNVDFGNITKLIWYYDYNNNPTDSVVITKDQMASDRKYTHNYGISNNTDVRNYAVVLRAYSGQTCFDITQPFTVTIKGNPLINLSQIKSICQDGSPTQIVEDKNGFVGTGVFSGNGTSSTGLFDPAVAGPGTTTVNYVFTAQNGCDYTASQQIMVSPSPLVSFDGDVTVLEGGQITLKPKVSGNGYTYKWVPSTGLDHDNVLNPAASPIEDTQYKLMVTSAEGCVGSAEVMVKVLKYPVVPNAFTPNNDGVNDSWNIKYLDSYPNNTVDIYNRYGEKLYSSVGYSVPWDGRYKGADLPTGTYYYIINPKNGRKIISGSVTIIR